MFASNSSHNIKKEYSIIFQTLYVNELYLYKCIISKLGTSQCRSRTKETRIRHFLYSLSNAQHKRGIYERYNDVRIIKIWKDNHVHVKSYTTASIHEQKQIPIPQNFV